MKRAKFIAAITVALGASVSVCAYIVAAGLDESRYFRRSSIDYYLLVHSKYVKEFPLPRDPVEVMYHSSCGDGPKRPSIAIHVKVRALDPGYADEIQQFVKYSQLTETLREGILSSSTVYVDNSGSEVELSLFKEASSYRVILKHRY